MDDLIHIYDSLDNKYERKNLYLKDLYEGKNVDKKNHLYIKQINEIKKLEKDFLLNLKNEVKKFKLENKNLSSKELKLKIELFEAKKLAKFYSNYVDLSYDYELFYKKYLLISERLPEIIYLYNNASNNIKEIKEKIKNISQEENNIKILEYKKNEKELYLKLKNEILNLKKLKDDGLISLKAYKNQKNQLLMELKDKLEILKLNIPLKNLKSDLSIQKYILNYDVASKYRIMWQDISDLYRKIPVEIEKENKILPYLSFFIPGLAQYINKQKFKAMLFFLGTLFIYFIAIPYFFGYGNYRGEGIKGLFTLAKGSKKIDKSIIYMIEGIISILLMLISITISSLSFKDAKDVIKKSLKGIRPKIDFETKESIKEDGFPYIVSIISFLLISFIVILPILTTVFLSFSGMDPNHQSKFYWVGLENYKLLILGKGIAGGPFWLILSWTIIWTIFATTLPIIVGFALALIANNDRIKGKVFFRTIYLLPWAIPAFITIMLFSIMLSSNGQITEFLRFFFKGDWSIKNDVVLSRIALILLQTWLGSSYIFLLSTGVLQGISKDLYEAADIDGATAFQKLTKITVPLVLFQIAPLLIVQYTFNFNNFSVIYLFNSGGPFDPSKYGNMAGSTDLLISYIYKLTIEKQYQSIGATISLFVSLALMLVTYIGFKNSKAFKEEK